MKHEDFNKFLEEILTKIKSVLANKSGDYSSMDDKMFNFKLAAEIDGITPIEALRGMQLKHRTSIRQGLDELLNGLGPRKIEWWYEKCIDDINYTILLLGLIKELIEELEDE